MKICILNYSSPKYLNGQKRLQQSLKEVGFAGDLLFWNQELPPLSPEHEESPMAFKPHAFDFARQAGYEVAIWIDAGGLAVRSLDTLIAAIKSQGYFFWSRYAVSVGEWSSDQVLESFGLSREQALKIPELITFCVGLDFRQPLAHQFLDQWLARADDGFSFRGIPRNLPLDYTNHNTDHSVSLDSRVKGHRHDQTIASLLAYQLKMKPSLYFCFDYIGEAGPKRQYAKYIPLNICLLQNRDIKQETFLTTMDRFGLKQGKLNRSLYLLGAANLTLSRWLKDAIKLRYKKIFKHWNI